MKSLFGYRRIVVTASALFAVVCLCAGRDTAAADPTLTRVTPYGGQPGAELEVVFRGDRLEDAEEILCNEPGLTFSEILAPEDQKGKEVRAKLKIAEDSIFGVHRLRIRTRTGISPLINFFVGPYAVVDEKEPNTDFTTPQEVDQRVTVHGRVDREDVDHFVVEAKKGQRLTAEIEGLRLGIFAAGNNFFDPCLAILNANRFELAVCDDHALTRQDAFVSIEVPEDGKYIIQVRDASYQGSGSALYRLHIGDFARPTGVVPAGGRPGETINVKMLGDVKGEFEQQVTLPSRVPLKFGFYPAQDGNVSPTHNRLRISELDNVIEVEPNENREQATLATLPSAANGVLINRDDVDYFKVQMKKNQQIDIDVFARRVRSSIDSVVDVYDAKGRRLAGDDDRKRPDSWVRFKAPADGDYFVRVRDQLGNGGPDYFYRIEMSPTTPAMEITTNDVSRYVQPDIEVPQGRRFAFLVSVRRENFGGPVSFEGLNLPQGVTLECPACWHDQGVVPILLRAEKEAPLSGSFADLKGTWKNPNNESQIVSANVVQKRLRVRGQNNTYVWTEDFQQVPIVVTQETPFDIEAIEPLVPIVRGGSMQLKVVATKAEGFDQDISVIVLQNPSGVSSSRSTKIKKGQTEGYITINASGNAPIRESEITIRATARVGNANVEVYSPFIKLRVAEKYMNMAYVSSAVEQGASVDFPVTIENLTPFEGTAKVELIGLPAKITTESTEITKETKQIVFPIKTEKDAPLGEKKNLFCRVVVMENGEPVLHNIGSGRLRVNKPVVVKKPAPKKVEPEPKKETKPKPKVLSRLEQLRIQQEELRKSLD